MSNLINPHDVHHVLGLLDLHVSEPVLLIIEEPVSSHGRLRGADLIQVVAGGPNGKLVQRLAPGELRVPRVVAEEQLLVGHALPSLQGTVL